MPLLVKILDERAVLPTCAHPGEDLGYDLYACEDVNVGTKATRVRTGISARYVNYDSEENYGLIIKDRSSMALKSVRTHGGVLDAGYTGEIVVIMSAKYAHFIKKGDKIAQMVPIPVLTAAGIVEVEDLGESERGSKGWGSSGN